MTAADTIKDLHVEVKRCPECGTGFGVEAAFCPFDGVALKTSTWDPTRDPLTDTVIDRRYEVIAPLGEGGMGTVYKVRHTTLNRMFAMKVLRRDLAADPGLAARFLQEARATAAIRHPSVVAINDFGELDDGAPYFVMELLVGETLATRMRARGLLTPSEAANIACKLADALSAAHAAKVVHRDLKPENVFLVGAQAGKAAADDIRVVDFGAAKIVGASKLTRPGVVFGTPYYMSPEQASGQSVDARADVYSLGVLLYEMITGDVPFEADTYMGVLTKHMFAVPAKPSERTPPGVQLGALDDAVMRALEKDPAARFQSMTELAGALFEAVEGRPSSRPQEERRSTRQLAFSSRSAADRIEASVSRQLEEERRRKRRTLVVVVVSAATTLALCALAMTLVDDGRTTSAKSSTAAQTTATPSVTTAAATAMVSAAPTSAASSAPNPSADPAAPVSVAIPIPSSTIARTALGGSPRPGNGSGGPARSPGAPAGASPTAGTPASRPAASSGKSSDELPDPWRPRQ